MSIPDAGPQVDSQIAVAARNYGMAFGQTAQLYNEYRRLYLDVRSPDASLLVEPPIQRFTYRELMTP